ncbi:MAG: choice-of-anchor tandem repeat GloVer-containing protein, partial [Cyclobacteriaceae bacterium]
MKKLLFLAVLTLYLGPWTLTSFAQYTKLLDFAGTSNGGAPNASLISDGTFLYGMTTTGGTSDLGTIFKIKLDGTGYAKLLDFTGAANGRSPGGSLFSDGTFLYGVTSGGGANNRGTIFKIMPDGTGYVELSNFSGAANGSIAVGTLTSVGAFLYGMTYQGGTNNRGTIFKIMPDGTGYAKLLDFTGAANGELPQGSLISDGTFLYGMTTEGGTNDLGTIFKIMPDGTGYVKLLDFASAANGNLPYGSLISDGIFLYGMASGGGTNSIGTIFKIMPDGSGFTKLLDFAGAVNGSSPYGSLISDGSFLYGMTNQGGLNSEGTVFKYSIASPVPTITSFTPASGPIGTTVTITGTNFSATPANNIVYFGATKATVTAATTTQLTVTVPVGATYKPISVQVAGLAAYSQSQFLVTFGGGGTINTCAFNPAVNFPLGATPYDVLLGDLDGDGKSDMIAANFNSRTVSVYRNISSTGAITLGSFATKVDFITNSATANPNGLALGDIDGDGKLDLVVANYIDLSGIATVSIFKNISSPGSFTSGSFAARVDFPCVGAFKPTIQDLDGDGKPEIAVTNYFNGGISVFRNTSTLGVINASSLSPKVDFTTGIYAYAITIHDIDSDGKPDLIATNINSNTISVLRNTSTQGAINPTSFATSVNFSTIVTPYNFAVGDLDNDQKPDLVVSNGNAGSDLSVFKNISVPGTINASSFATRVDFATGAGP